MKEMTSVATTMMTEEEKAEMEKEMNEAGVGTTTPPGSVAHTTTPPERSGAGTPAPSAPSAPSEPAAPQPQHPHASATPANGATHLHVATSTSPAPSADSGKSPLKDKGKGKNKLTPEQRKKLQELDDERRKNMKERVDMLKGKLIERLRPFVEAKNPGGQDDPETKAFEARMKREADDLKLESFGVEVRTPCLSWWIVH